ncbi:hypothetical protein [Laspinema palackyanum]
MSRFNRKAKGAIASATGGCDPGSDRTSGDRIGPGPTLVMNWIK